MRKALDVERETDEDTEPGIRLTRERLEQLATQHEFAPAPPLAQAWNFSAAEIQAIHCIQADAGSKNTDRSYTAAERYWNAWYWLRYQTRLTLPVPPVAVLRFITDHVAHWPDRKRPDFESYLLPAWIEQQLVGQGLKRSGPWKPNTIEQRISVLSSMHDQQRDANNDPLINPCRDPYVIKLLRVVRRAYAKHDRGPIGRDAATVDQLEKMLEHGVVRPTRRDL